MPTFTALTLVDDADRAQRLGAAMEEMTPEPTGIGIFEMEDGSGLWEVGGYFTDAPGAADLALLAAAFGARDFAVSELPETDWVAKVRRELAPVPAGRFFVHGSHDADKVTEGAVPLLVEASMAFGTGHHGTTLGCLLTFERLLKRGVPLTSIADIGCGTAVLAMAAAKVTDTVPIASDIDAVAVEVAAANVAANRLKGRVACLEAVGFAHPDITDAAPFDLVFANILKGPLIDLAPDMAAHLARDGFAIMSGILVDQADEVAAVYSLSGINEVERMVIGDWVTLLVQRKDG